MVAKVAPAIALLLALTAGVLAWQQWQGRLALKKQVTSLTWEVANKNDALKEQAVLLDRLQEENDVYSKELTSLREKVSTRVSPPGVAQDAESGPSPTSKNGTATMFSRMTEDPKIKEVTRQWHSARLKQIYGDFVSERQLGPQQSKQFFDLLARDDCRARNGSPVSWRRQSRSTSSRRANRTACVAETLTPGRIFYRRSSGSLGDQFDPASLIWIPATAMPPSPTAAAQRLTEPERTSPAAKIPGRLVSSGLG